MTSSSDKTFTLMFWAAARLAVPFLFFFFFFSGFNCHQSFPAVVTTKKDAYAKTN